MHRIVFALIAGVSLVAGGSIGFDHKTHDFRHESIHLPKSLKLIVDKDAFGHVDKYLQGALTSPQVVNCTIREVETIIDVCDQFVETVIHCGDYAATKLLLQITDIKRLANDIALLNKGFCDSDEDEDDSDGDDDDDVAPITRCAELIAQKIGSMSKQILNVLSSGVEATTCLVDAFEKVVPKFMEFPAIIAKCF